MSSFDAQITFLPVADLDRSRSFYEGVLGLGVSVDQGSCLIFSTGAGGFLGVCQREGAMRAEGVIITLVTDEVDTWFRRLTDAGHPTDGPPSHSEQYGIYHVFFRDPDGHQLEIQRFDDPDWAAGP